MKEEIREEESCRLGVNTGDVIYGGDNYNVIQRIQKFNFIGQKIQRALIKDIFL